MYELTSIVVFTKAVVLPPGVGITLFAYRAYRRTGDPSLRSFAGGFAAVTAGTTVGGGFELLFGVDLAVGLVAQGLLTAIGFALLARSLYVRDVNLRDPATRESAPDR